MRKYRIGSAFNEKYIDNIYNLLTIGKDLPNNKLNFEEVRKEKSPLSIVVETDRYAYLSETDLEDNIKKVAKALSVDIGPIMVMDE